MITAYQHSCVARDSPRQNIFLAIYFPICKKPYNYRTQVVLQERVINSAEPLDRHRKINAVTGSISQDDWTRWQPHSSLILFKDTQRDLFHRRYSRHIIFPTTSIFSVSSDSRSGGLAESSLTGNEGLVGLCKLTNRSALAMNFTLQTSGFGIVISTDFLRREIEVSSSFRKCVLDYSSAIVRYATQTCFCYRYHSIEQQIIKMILLTLRRTGGYEIPMTHERIGAILGIRREAASTAIGHLSQMSLVHQSRSLLIVPEFSRLETHACECYSAICRILGYSSRGLIMRNSRHVC